MPSGDAGSRPSWEVITLDRGKSELIKADWWNYPNFCDRLKERFAYAWAAASAPAEAEVELRSFDSHLEMMAEREVPDCFTGIW